MNSGTKTGAIKGVGKAVSSLGTVAGIVGGVAMLKECQVDPNEYCKDCNKLMKEEGCVRMCLKCTCVFTLNYSNEMKSSCYCVCPQHTPKDYIN